MVMKLEQSEIDARNDLNSQKDQTFADILGSNICLLTYTRIDLFNPVPFCSFNDGTKVMCAKNHRTCWSSQIFKNKLKL